MTDEPDVNVEVDDQPSLSWQENELVSALRRLANARSQLATLEAEADRASQVPPVGAAAADALVKNHAQLQSASAKAAKARFGGSARKRAHELEATEQRLLAASGLESYDAFLARQSATPPPTTSLDRAVLDFARREVASATAAVAQVQALEMPEVAVESADDDAESESASAEAMPHPFVHPEAS